MRIQAGLWLVPLAFATGHVAAQESADTEKLELRVVDSQPGRATLDRGRVDGLRVGDRIVLRPRDGLPIEGHVLEVTERSASVEFDDPARTAQPGTRGEAWVPRASPADSVPAQSAEPQPGVPEHPAWPAPAQDWTQGMPLLTEVQALRPAQRSPAVHGRWYLIADHLVDLGDQYSYGFDRAGVDSTWSNAFGNGADVHLDVEWNWRNAVVPDADDEHETYVRLDRLSYILGGNRFVPERVELGRFLQNGMPELGVLDGVEWSTRILGGNSYGASFGYMPEPDARQQSFRDLQVAAWYRWVGDETERSALQLGVQQTFHDYSNDRQLLLARVDLIPKHGWDFHAAVWVDYYTAHDAAKGAGLELTQAIFSLGRLFEGGSSMTLTGTHVSFPEMDRWEFPPVSAAQLADDHVERIALRARQSTATWLWLREEAGVWSDQDDRGADGEFGFELERIAFEGGRLRASGFASDSATSAFWGVRLGLGRELDQGSWDLGYEFTQYDFTGFTDANDQLPQHRLRISREFHTLGGWSFSAHAEWLNYAQEDSLAAGIYLQRSF